MDIRLKQRVVGISVIVIAILLLAFLLFTGSRPEGALPLIATKIPPTPPQPTIQKSPLAAPQAWTVQLASFWQKEHADKLLARLKKQGFTAYIEQKSANHTVIYQVFVGPEIERQKAERLLTTLYSKLQLKGLIVQYSVNPGDNDAGT